MRQKKKPMMQALQSLSLRDSMLEQHFRLEWSDLWILLHPVAGGSCTRKTATPNEPKVTLKDQGP